MPIVELSKSDKKRKLLRLAFESVTVVWLSTYRPPSVNAVSAISHKKVSVCVCVRALSGDCDQSDSKSVRQFFSSPFSLSLSRLSCLSGLDLSPLLPEIDVSIPCVL